MTTTGTVPRDAEVVIVGGGIGGCSIAYHLAKLGVKEVVLVERRQLTCGTTWHAAGLVGTLWPTKNMTQLGKYSHELYQALEAETGQATGYRRTGSITLATTPERMEELKRSADMARVFGVQVDVVGPQTLGELYPGLQTADLVGGLHIFGDGQTNPVDTTMALAKGARARGALLLENTTATRILVDGGRAVGVETDRGAIRARKVVLAGGMWSRDLAAAIGVTLPLYACAHYYVVTEPIPALQKNLPIMRDLDNGNYFKEDAGKLLVGFFEDNAHPVDMSRISADFCFDELPADVEHFERYLARAIERFPAMAETGIRTFFCGPESFTADNQHIMGEAPGIRDFYVACGFNSRGIGGGGGIGKMMAEWIVRGHPTMDLWESDVRRVMPHQGNEAYLRNRVGEALTRSYAMHWPYQQYESSRDQRHSPVHAFLNTRGACFGEVAGWERPNWFAPSGEEPRYRYSYQRSNWFFAARQEHLAVRTAAGLYDASSLAKFLVRGREAENFLQRLCTNDVAVPTGQTVYTQWLNERGGIEADLTVAKLGEQEFMISTPCASQVKDLAWLKDHVPPSGGVELLDVTCDYAVLSIHGPQSREIVRRVYGDDIAMLPFGCAKWIQTDGASIWAQRLSYPGEVGWELFVSAINAETALKALEDAGRMGGLVFVGMHAVDSLRLEKGFRHWGHDVTYEDTPIDAGLSFTCRFDKKIPFIGRDAVLRQRDAGRRTRALVQFLLDDPEPLLFHNEPILRDGHRVGYLTSGGYAHHLGRAIGMGYVTDPGGVDAATISASQYQIVVAGVPVSARASLRPFYDPSGDRMRS